jgi:hypothetical protein
MFAKLSNLKLTYVISLITIVMPLTSILSGCQQEWNFTITDLSNPSHPHFCISRSRAFKCTEAYGVSFSRLSIWESNKQGEYIKQVWGVEAVGNSKISKLIYGVVPKGYKETIEAIPIEIGKIYIMDNLRYFRFY